MKSISILLPDGAPCVIQPGKEGYVSLLVRPGESRPFKILSAERVDGIDYDAFTCPGFFLGALNIPAAPGNPWPLSLMFSGFAWPGGGLTEFAANIPFVGQVDFRFRLINHSDKPQPFAIRLVGLELS